MVLVPFCLPFQIGTANEGSRVLHWRADAECSGTSSDLFFINPKLKVDKKYRLEKEAKAICKVCTVKLECEDYAVSNPSLVSDGIWGGLNYKEIRRERRKRK